jgi:general secretion pathway protein M
MINPAGKRTPRGALFLAVNASAAAFLVLFVFVPMLTHFTGRSEEIAENAAQLAHFENIARNARTLMKRTSQGGDPFLPGGEERVVSADLQAGLKTIATNAGVRIVGIRGLQGSRSQQLHMVAASMELEGSLSAVRDVVLALENQTPYLFITAASLRSAADGDENLFRAELKVQGAMRNNGSPSGAMDAVSQ